MTETKKQEVILPSGSVSITECAESLFAIIAPSHHIFQRGGQVQELGRGEKGEVILSMLRDEQFQSRMEEYAELTKWVKVNDDYAKKSTICPKQMAAALLASRPAETMLPRIRGLANCPVICYPSLEVLTKGYHRAMGGILVLHGGEVPEMPIKEAVELLNGILEEFTFTTPADKSRALAMLITPAMRMGGWIHGNCPMFAIEADKSQTGKGYILKLLYALYNETSHLVTVKDGGVGGFDESLQQAMLSGKPFIQLDNIRGKMASAFLEMAMTADGMVGCRVPHRGEVAVDSTHFVFTCTSNGMESTPDLANRSCIIRLRKREGYAFKDYGDSVDILGHIRDNQELYLAAVFAVIKAWEGLGCQRSCEVRHDFRRWVQTLDWIVANILQAGAIMDGHMEAQTSVANPALVWLRKVAVAIEGEKRLGVSMSAHEIADISGEHDIPIPNCKSSASDADKGRRIGILMKKLMPDEMTVLGFDAYEITRTVEQVFDENHGGFRSKKHYTVKNVKVEKAPSNDVLLPQLPQLPQDNMLPRKYRIFHESNSLVAVEAMEAQTLDNNHSESTNDSQFSTDQEEFPL